METWAFNPLYFNTGNAGTPAGTLLASITITLVASTAQAVVLPGGNSSVRQIQMANQTTTWCFVNFGIAGAVVAAAIATGYPVAPGAVVVVTVADEVTGASVITTGTGAFTFTRGNGV